MQEAMWTDLIRDECHAWATLLPESFDVFVWKIVSHAERYGALDWMARRLPGGLEEARQELWWLLHERLEPTLYHREPAMDFDYGGKQDLAKFSETSPEFFIPAGKVIASRIDAERLYQEVMEELQKEK